MGVLSSLFEQRLSPSRGGLWPLGRWSAQSNAGPAVSEEASLQTSAVWACVRIISEGLASLPLMLYRRDGRRRVRAEDHPLFPILHDEANEEITAFELREFLFAQTLLWGNGYAYIEWDEAGQVREVWPLRSDRVEVWRLEDGNLWYRYSPRNHAEDRLGPRWLPFHMVHHVRGLSGDGVMGYSPIRVAAKEAVGLALATEEFGARFFSNGAQPRVLLMHPGRLSPEAYRRLKESFADENVGLSNAHKTRILEEGMGLETVGIPPEEAQFLETRKFQVTEIARIFRVPPHMLADLERATFSNIEHQSIDFVRYTLRPWMVRHEQAIRRDFLIGADEKRRYFAKYVAEGLLRGDTLSRYQSYQSAINASWMTPNEARELEDLDPIEGGDKRLIPLNMVEEGKPTGPSGRSDPSSALFASGSARHLERRADAEEIGRERQRLARAQASTLEDVAARIVRRETADIERAVKKYLVNGDDLQGFLLWIGQFYDEHAAFVARQMRPPLETVALLVLESVASELDDDGLTDQEADLLDWLAEYVEGLGNRWSASNRGEIEALLREAEDNAARAEQVQARLDGWAETEAQKVGRRESTRGVNALAKAAYLIAGVTTLMWVADGESCPYCQDLDGKRVGISSFFVEGGTDFQPEGAAEPLKVRRSVGHPPVHDGCNCSIIAG